MTRTKKQKYFLSGSRSGFRSGARSGSGSRSGSRSGSWSWSWSGSGSSSSVFDLFGPSVVLHHLCGADVFKIVVGKNA